MTNALLRGSSGGARNRMARVAISIGCPSGVGPEVSVLAAAAAWERDVQCVLVGDMGVLRRACAIRAPMCASRLFLIEPNASAPVPSDGSIPVVDPSDRLHADDCVPGRPTARGGAAQLWWVNTASDLAAW
jgi:4-hydroxy-L-threonine phosphate dehydrogenase PdxA